MTRTIEIEASIASLAPGGDGVAHAEIGGERRAVFVAYAAPGDVARVEVDPSHRPARGRIVSLTRAGIDRVAPACPWSTQCGGCDWMHLSAGAQATSHADHLRAALPAGWRDASIDSTAAPHLLGYRTRARVHVRSVSRGRIVVGMNEARSHEPVEVESCAVLDPAVERARRLVAPLLAGSRGKGEVQIALGANRAPVLDVRWDGEVASESFARLEAAVFDGSLAGADVTVGGASRPARVGEPSPWTTAADGEPLRLAAGGFGQANDDVNAALARHVAALVRPWAADKAVELHAGSGNLSVLLAREVGALACVESNRDACEAARENLAARGLAGARVIEADAEGYAWSKATQLVVLDPPRTGARAVAERLASARVAHVVYVSCDAQTLGRDLAILENAYAPTSIATFEMFPQTSHVEAVVALKRRRPS
jgi:23S rRNA (uracil1939-C5)-methyltransferase